MSLKEHQRKAHHLKEIFSNLLYVSIRGKVFYMIKVNDTSSLGPFAASI